MHELLVRPKYDTTLNKKKIKNPVLDNNMTRLAIRKKTQYNGSLFQSNTYSTKTDRKITFYMK